MDRALKQLLKVFGMRRWKTAAKKRTQNIESRFCNHIQQLTSYRGKKGERIERSWFESGLVQTKRLVLRLREQVSGRN